ncbi:Co2+/Mg2+ efflux protein ApaG [Sandaracinobacteroides saxicola]|uniref:Protein ApaG n=1 Tax=Sandaracinobacteroides saxicola TaxID=2759707 RepID=A0A7G5IMT1_9SPHN|nr:Co2+/Mg2+ efflux protein ApaG [Sandaracinobacteroides saxicola]QMW24673.1 Co2+/Mg2+ efflux protein ApaG [Sandaracinobacteroides saxicola]
MAAFFDAEATTRGVTVRVKPHYLADQSAPERGHWAWSYHIRIENHGAAPVQLLTRHWVITDGRGRRQEVRGDGVVGEQPVIPPGGAHDYVSGCPLETPQGHMAGSYGMVDADGGAFEVVIPAFALVSPAARRLAN